MKQIGALWFLVIALSVVCVFLAVRLNKSSSPAHKRVDLIVDPSGHVGIYSLKGDTVTWTRYGQIPGSQFVTHFSLKNDNGKSFCTNDNLEAKLSETHPQEECTFAESTDILHAIKTPQEGRSSSADIRESTPTDSTPYKPYSKKGDNATPCRGCLVGSRGSNYQFDFTRGKQDSSPTFAIECNGTSGPKDLKSDIDLSMFERGFWRSSDNKGISIDFGSNDASPCKEGNPITNELNAQCTPKLDLVLPKDGLYFPYKLHADVCGPLFNSNESLHIFRSELE